MYDELSEIAKEGFLSSPMKCHFCGVPIAFGEPGSSINSEYGNCHTKCLYDYREEDVPEALL